MRNSYLFVLLLGVLLWGPIGLQANNLTINNLSRDSLAQTLSFDLQWQSSWRLDPATMPGNWDAAWIFVKLLECDAQANTPWTHGILSTNTSDHDFGSLEAVLTDGSAVGIDADGTGVMLRRSSQGFFSPVNPVSILLYVPNMDPNTAYHVRVIGIEMVYVSTGAYELGSVTYDNAFATTSTGTNTTPIGISSEVATTIISHASGANSSVDLSAAYPKGYAGFHIMKYEISQGQYATFLNTLAPSAQLNRYPGNFGIYRNELSGTGPGPFSIYTSSRPNRSQNYLGWEDVAAYLDWAALRPMTEMEFEKACRGTAPSFLGEYAWGSDNIFQLVEITAPEDGTEIPGTFPANAHYVNNAISGGDGGHGPVRSGIFALPVSSTRDQSGAAYYAAMEMSGNVWEVCIDVSADTDISGGVAFTNSPGDGTLDALGDANQIGWPAAADGGFIRRGGSWYNGSDDLRISDRSQLGWSGTRDRYTGGRGVRN